MISKYYFYFLLPGLFFAFAACRHGGDKVVEPDACQAVPEVAVVDTVAPEVAVDDTTPVVEPTKVEKPKVYKVAQPRKTEPKSLYVESYDVKGLVWGHVTMDGDTGTGTIHDSGENTYSVSCTRHGNELFAVDQNGRRYVFAINE